MKKRILLIYRFDAGLTKGENMAQAQPLTYVEAIALIRAAVLRDTNDLYRLPAKLPKKAKSIQFVCSAQVDWTGTMMSWGDQPLAAQFLTQLTAKPGVTVQPGPGTQV